MMMTPEQWTANVQRWLARHPLKSPPAAFQADYAREVMRRIKLAEAPAPVYRWVPQRVWQPRFVFAMATIAACALVAVVMIPKRQAQLANTQMEREAIVLASMGDAASDVVPQSDEELADEVAMLDDLMTLAKNTPASDDQAWIEQTLKVFEQLDNGAPLDDVLPDNAGASEEELLDELQQLDQTQGSATS